MFCFVSGILLRCEHQACLLMKMKGLYEKLSILTQIYLWHSVGSSGLGHLEVTSHHSCVIANVDDLGTKDPWNLYSKGFFWMSSWNKCSLKFTLNWEIGAVILAVLPESVYYYEAIKTEKLNQCFISNHY